MKINYNNRTNFQASFVNTCKVGKYSTSEKKYNDTDVNFVKLNPLDKNDINTLDKIANSWDYDKFSTNIYNNANDIFKKHQSNSSLEFKNDFFYAVTSQKDNFENLDYRHVLGVCDGRIFPDNEIYVTHIQVNPDYIYSRKPKYKGAGSAIINSLKNLYSTIELSTLKEKSVRNFYEKHGFVKVPQLVSRLIWKK